MFQFRRFPTYAYLIQHMLLRLLLVGFPIRISPDLSLFAAPRSFSQLITSFIGSWCQGIPLALFFAWPLNLLCSSFTSSCRSIHFWFLFKFYKNYAGSHFFVSLLAKLLFTLNFCFLTVAFSYRFSFTLCSVFKVHHWATKNWRLIEIPYWRLQSTFKRRWNLKVACEAAYPLN